MKNTPVLIIFLLCGISLNAQLVTPWLKSTTSENINITNRFFGGTYADEHFYLVGEYWRDIAFDEYALAMLPSDDYHNGFIAKMNTAGEMVDLFDVSGSDLQRTTEIEVASDGTLWVSGLFQKEMTYGSTTVTAQGFFESFLLHLSEEGNLLEMYHFPVEGMYDGVSLYNIEMDLNGNLWLAFSFLGDFIFNGVEYNGGINQDGLIVQMSPDGNVLRSHYFEVAEGTEEVPLLLFLDMMVDTDNNLVLAGTVGGEVLIDGVPMEDVSTFTSYGFVAKFASDGPLMWTQTYVSNGARVNSITIDDKDRIYLGFQFEDFIIFDNETLNGSLSFADMAIARISPLGTPQWIEIFNHGVNPGTNGGVYVTSLQLLDEQLLVGGLFDDRIIHDGVTIMDGIDRQLGCILNMDLSGGIIDSWMLSSPSSYNRINTMVSSPLGLWYGGEYYNSVGIENTMVSSPASAVFYGMLTTDQIVANDNLSVVENVTVFPNPILDQLHISGLPDKDGKLTIRDAMGRYCTAFSVNNSGTSFDLSFLPSGYYTWQWQNSKNVASGTFVKAR